MSKEQDVFILSEQALLKVVNQITDDQWDVKVTEPLAGGRDLTLRQLVNYHVYDDVWVPDTLAGKTIAEVGAKYDGDLLGSDPKASFAATVDKAEAAVHALGEPDLDRPAHLTYGDYPVREYLKHITSFRGFRAYTIAKYLGVDSTLDPALVQGMWDLFGPEVEAWRTMGVFGPAIDVPEESDLQTRLLALTGFLQ